VSSSGLRRAWQIHGVVLAALVVLYIGVFWDHYTGPPRGGFDLTGFAAAILLVVLIGYALISSVLMLWVGRRVWGPLVMHGLALAGYAASLAAEKQENDERAREAARREAAEQRLRVDDCVELRDLRVIRGTPLRAAVELYSGCAVPVAVERVDVRGDPPDGFGVALDTDLSTPKPLAPRQGAVFVLESRMPHDPPVEGGWRWQVHVRVVEPEYAHPCFATPGSGAPAVCAPIGRVTLADI